VAIPRQDADFASRAPEWRLQSRAIMMVLLAMALPACVVAVIVFVVWGPVPKRRSLFAPRAAVPATYVTPPAVSPTAFAALEPAFSPAPIAPAPPPLAIADATPRPEPTPVPRVARALPVEVPRERPQPAFNPALAPVVRTPRGAELPPLRRVARGTDAPPILAAPLPLPLPEDLHADVGDSTDTEIPIVELEDFEIEELTRLDHA
jgi:hypothetical protein